VRRTASELKRRTHLALHDRLQNLFVLVQPQPGKLGFPDLGVSAGFKVPYVSAGAGSRQRFQTDATADIRARF
jgi:hypothetical protein